MTAEICLLSALLLPGPAVEPLLPSVEDTVCVAVVVVAVAAEVVTVDDNALPEVDTPDT